MSTSTRLAYSTTTPTPAQRLHSSLNPDVLVHAPHKPIPFVLRNAMASRETCRTLFCVLNGQPHDKCDVGQ